MIYRHGLRGDVWIERGGADTPLWTFRACRRRCDAVRPFIASALSKLYLTGRALHRLPRATEDHVTCPYPGFSGFADNGIRLRIRYLAGVCFPHLRENWLQRRESNPRYSGYEPEALPLGDAA